MWASLTRSADTTYGWAKRSTLLLPLGSRTRITEYPVPEASSLCKELVVEELLGRVPGLGPRGHAIVQEALEGLVEKRRYLSK